MDVYTLKTFFMWCTIFNGGLLVLWSLLTMFAPNLVYKTQKKFFPMEKEKFTIVMYGFLGLFKIFFLMFNLIPFIAFLIICSAK